MSFREAGDCTLEDRRLRALTMRPHTEAAHQSMAQLDTTISGVWGA